MQRIQSNHSDKIWAKEFSNMLKKKTTEPEGQGWLDFEQILKISPLNKNQLRLYLSENVKNKKIEKFRGTKIVNNKLNCSIWYRPVLI